MVKSGVRCSVPPQVFFIMSRKAPVHHSKPGNRPLRVGEEIRHALSQLIMRGETGSPDLDGVSITVSEVRVSPDLKNATAYVMPLGGEQKQAVLESLIRVAPHLRVLVAKQMALRYMPRIHFKLDDSYEEASRIDALLRNPHVARDIKGEEP